MFVSALHTPHSPRASQARSHAVPDETVRRVGQGGALGEEESGWRWWAFDEGETVETVETVGFRESETGQYRLL